VSQYFHSVTLDKSLCKGCTNCIKRCPTEAIRVTGGKSHIIEERCIDCGECIRTCANHAKSALVDGFDRLSEFDYRIALPPPAFFGLWKPQSEIPVACARLLSLGFDEVFEVAVAADVVAQATRLLVKDRNRPKPYISSACPAVIRLMQVRFPSLLPNLIPLEAPIEIAATLAKEEALARTGMPADRIGAFFLSPCPAKVTAIKQPVGRMRSNIDAALSISEVYGAIARMPASKAKPVTIRGTPSGIGWGGAGGEADATGIKAAVSVAGIHSVIQVLDEIERGRIHDIQYIEAQACVGGCLGGCLVSQNPFISKVRLVAAAETYGARQPAVPPIEVGRLLRSSKLSFDHPIEPRPVMKLDPDLARALVMMRDLEKTLETLPGLDCGACGSPSCRALAEDIVRGNALKTDCIFLLRERVRELAEEMVDLARKVPPSMGQQAAGPSGSAEVGKRAQDETGGGGRDDSR